MILLVLLFAFTYADAVQAEIQFPPLTGRVVDLADLLPPDAEKALSDKLAAHEAATSNQIVVVTLPDLQGRGIADYGYQLGRHWGIGSKEHDNGALLIVAPEQRKVRMEVGYGLEGALTDALSRTIIDREILPRFKTGDMAGGIAAGSEAILQAVAGEYTAPASGASGSDIFPFAGLTAAFGGILGGFARFRGWKARVGLVMLPVAAAGTWASDLSATASTGDFFLTLAVLSFMGLMAFLVVGFGQSTDVRGGYYGGGSGGFSGGGGGFSGGGGSYGGGGASGSW